MSKTALFCCLALALALPALAWADDLPHVVLDGDMSLASDEYAWDGPYKVQQLRHYTKDGQARVAVTLSDGNGYASTGPEFWVIFQAGFVSQQNMYVYKSATGWALMKVMTPDAGPP